MTLRLTVHLFGFLREITGYGKIGIEASDGATLGDLLSHLERRFGERFRMAVLSQGSIDNSIAISVDGFVVRDLGYPLRDGQVIFITPALVGGAEHSASMVRCLNCLARIEVKEGEEKIRCPKCGLEYIVSWVSPTQPKLRRPAAEVRRP